MRNSKQSNDDILNWSGKKIKWKEVIIKKIVKKDKDFNEIILAPIGNQNTNNSFKMTKGIIKTNME